MDGGCILLRLLLQALGAPSIATVFSKCFLLLFHMKLITKLIDGAPKDCNGWGYVPPKHRFTYGLHGAISQKMATFISMG
jgi:hypothetical protein